MRGDAPNQQALSAISSQRCTGMEQAPKAEQHVFKMEAGGTCGLLQSGAVAISRFPLDGKCRLRTGAALVKNQTSPHALWCVPRSDAMVNTAWVQAVAEPTGALRSRPPIKSAPSA